MLYLGSIQHTNNFWQWFNVHGLLDFWAHLQKHQDMYTKSVEQIIKDRSYAISYAIWACYLCPVALGTLPAAQGVTYKVFKLLVFL